MSLDEEQQFHANVIAAVGRRLGANDRDIQTAITVALATSGLRSDGSPTGIFGQDDAWGPLPERQDPIRAATMFFVGANGNRGLLQIPGRDRTTVAQAATAVQAAPGPAAYAAQVPVAAEVVLATPQPDQASGPVDAGSEMGHRVGQFVNGARLVYTAVQKWVDHRMADPWREFDKQNAEWEAKYGPRPMVTGPRPNFEVPAEVPRDKPDYRPDRPAPRLPERAAGLVEDVAKTAGRAGRVLSTVKGAAGGVATVGATIIANRSGHSNESIATSPAETELDRMTPDQRREFWRGGGQVDPHTGHLQHP